VHVVNYVTLGRFMCMEHLVFMHTNSVARNFFTPKFASRDAIVSHRGGFGSHSRVLCCGFDDREFAYGVVT